LRDRGRRWTLPRWLASLAYTSPGRSHLFPLTPILDELHGRGHQIVLRTLASQVSSMRARGFDVEPISAPIETIELDDWRARNSLQSVRQNARTFCARAEHDAPDLERAVADIDPDALLVDINSWGGLMVFVIARIKEAHDHGLPDREAIALGIERTGRIITAAALLFCVAIGALATSDLFFTKQLGLGTALAVAVDASIVRALFVPS
jgi:hypothetical protein